MRLFALRLPNGRNLISAGLYGPPAARLLCLWFGARLVLVDLKHAESWRPSGRAGW